MIRSVFGILCLCVWLPVYAVPIAISTPEAPPQAGASPTELNRSGSELIKQNKYDDAKTVFEQALALARQQHDARQEAYALLGLGRVHYSRGEYAEAIKYAEDVVTRFESLRDTAGLARAYGLRGAVRNLQGEPQQALADYEKALAYCDQAGEQTSKAILLFDMTFVSTLPVERAMVNLQQSAEIAREVGDERLQAHVLHAWADHLAVQSRFADADEKLQAAAKLMQRIGDRQGLARVFTSNGRLLRLQGQPARAIEFYRDALDIQQQIGDRTGVIQSYNAMGVAYSYMDDYVKAGESYQRGLELALQSGSPRIIDFMTGALASNYLERNDYAQAAKLLEQIIARGKDEWLDARYAELARAYSALSRYDEALASIDKSITIRRQKALTIDLPDFLALRAWILTKLGRTDEAVAGARESLRVIEEERAHVVPTDALKRSYAEAMQLYYSTTIALLVNQGRPNEALEAGEQARARAFLDLLATRELALRRNNSRVAAPMKTAATHPSGATDRVPSRTPDLLPRGFSPAPGNSMQESAGSELQSSAVAEALSARELAEIARRLHSTVLSYWVNPDAVYIWTVRADGSIHVAKSAVSRDRLNKVIAEASGDAGVLPARGEESAVGPDRSARIEVQTRGGMTLQLGRDAAAPWRQLYALLIRPVAAWLPPRNSRLTIIPHGPLFRLSFAALLDEKGRYLVEAYELHYAPAGAVLKFTRGNLKPHKDTNGRYLLIADPSAIPSDKNGDALGRLPGARSEVAATVGLLHGRAATVLEGAAATEDRVRRELEGSRVIHFATHGIVRDDSPLDSFLALSRGASGLSGDDGRLTAQDVYGLELHADLVFLSTCRSARGKITGDGVAGMTRSFVYAGAPSVVASLWDVADEPTRRLVVEFYRAYVANVGPARALRIAQLHLLGQLRGAGIVISTPAGPLTLHDYPALWAGFVVIGEP